MSAAIARKVHEKPNTGKPCRCGKYHYRCDQCDADCTEGKKAGPAHSGAGIPGILCRECFHKHDAARVRLHDAAPALAEALEALVEAVGETGELSRLSEYSIVEVRELAVSALRAAGRL